MILNSSENQNVRRRVTHNQLLNLWEFLNANREIATGFNKSLQAREHSKRMWLRAASILNSAGEGAMRSGPDWCKVTMCLYNLLLLVEFEPKTLVAFEPETPFLNII